MARRSTDFCPISSGCPCRKRAPFAEMSHTATGDAPNCAESGGSSRKRSLVRRFRAAASIMMCGVGDGLTYSTTEDFGVISVTGRPYNVITFDCYGTLIDWEGGIAGAFAEAAAEDGVRLDDDAVLRAY